jgi:hypothetical protein
LVIVIHSFDNSPNIGWNVNRLAGHHHLSFLRMTSLEPDCAAGDFLDHFSMKVGGGNVAIFASSLAARSAVVSVRRGPS